MVFGILLLIDVIFSRVGEHAPAVAKGRAKNTRVLGTRAVASARAHNGLSISGGRKYPRRVNETPAPFVRVPYSIYTLYRLRRVDRFPAFLPARVRAVDSNLIKTNKKKDSHAASMGHGQLLLASESTDDTKPRFAFLEDDYHPTRLGEMHQPSKYRRRFPSLLISIAVQNGTRKTATVRH